MNGEYTGVTFRRMSAADRHDVWTLLAPPDGLPAPIRERGEAALGAALTLFEDRPDFGFVWVAYHDDAALACCTVSFAISASYGGVIARIDDFGVAKDAEFDIIERTISALGEVLRADDVSRVEATVDVNATSYARSLEGMGFRNVHRLTWSIALADLAENE